VGGEGSESLILFWRDFFKGVDVLAICNLACSIGAEA
jgi:hypothetical protein